MMDDKTSNFMSQDDLATLIQDTARRVRARDFVWTAAICVGMTFASLVFVVFIRPSVGVWWFPLVFLAVLLAALAVRYRFSSGRDWATPVGRAIEAEFSVAAAEITQLRLAREVAQSLPDPVFILEETGVIALANPAASAFLKSEALEGRHFAAVMRAPEVFEAAEKILDGGQAGAVDFVTRGETERSCRAYTMPIAGDVEGHQAMVYIRDLTTERRLEKMRVDFIASASHELRTPLASLLGSIDTLQGRGKDDPNAREKFLGIMHSQATRMQRLVSDLMALSRIELNEHIPPAEEVDLAAIVADAVDAASTVLPDDNASVELVNQDVQPLPLIGDYDEVYQCVQNLIDNALKYGGDPAMVQVRIGRGVAPGLGGDEGLSQRVGDTAAQIAGRLNRSVEEIIFFQVKDFGPGIDRGDLPRLTERFYRVSVERSRKSGGTGLGLAIVKHIVNRHQGGFQVESKPAGGSLFTCYFPAALSLTANGERPSA